MAVETAVHIHGNPFVEKVWEKRSPEIQTKQSLKAEKLVDKVDTVVSVSGDEGSDYQSDYCVIAAATKVPGTHQRPPILVSDRTNTNLRTSSRSYREFVQKHTQGNVYEPPNVIKSQPRSDQGLRISKSQYKQYEEATQLFCCGRKVDWLIDRATCMCATKAALYHCTEDWDEGGTDLEQPCACGTPNAGCISRWGCIGLCSIIFPCLFCYLPLKGCAHVAEGYKKHRSISRRRRPHDQT